jgi:hypothetical protein
VSIEEVIRVLSAALEAFAAATVLLEARRKSAHREEGGQMYDWSQVAWQESSHSSGSGCVEVAFLDDRVAVRDSKDRQGRVVVFSYREWAAFTGGVRDGEFDPPA